MQLLDSLGRIWTWLLARPHICFLAVSIPVAIIFGIVTPPFQAPDEPTHFYKAVTLSPLIAERFDEQRVGALLEKRYPDTADRYFRPRIDSHATLTPSFILDDITNPQGDTRQTEVLFENTAVYAPLAYVPQAIVIAVARLFDSPVIIQLYLARLSVAATAITLLFFALRWMPYGKWAILALALTPVGLFMMSSASGDAITVGILALFVAAILRKIQDGSQVLRKDVLLFVVLAAALGLCKAPYMLGALLIVAIPAVQFADIWHKLRTWLAVLGLPFILAVAWSFATRNIFINVSAGSDNAGQIASLADNPIVYAAYFIKSLFVSSVNNTLPQQAVDLVNGMYVPSPQWMIIIIYIGITLALLLAPRPVIVPRVVRMISLAIAITGMIAAALLIYISFSPVGSHEIIGLQGRYFMPFVYMLVPAFAGALVLRSKQQYTRFTGVLLFAIVACALYSVFALIARYYFHSICCQ